MFFKYVGGDDAPQVTVVYGLKFVLNGDAVEVADPFVQKKLSGNVSFLNVADASSLALQLPETSVEAETPPQEAPESQVPLSDEEKPLPSNSEPISYNEMCDFVKKADGGQLKSSKKKYVEHRYAELTKKVG